jgi:hypothetical protein
LRRVRFRERIATRVDGAASATVTIEGPPGELMFCVRPMRRRRLYVLPLNVVARGVVYDVVRAELVRQVKQGARRRTR